MSAIGWFPKVNSKGDVVCGDTIIRILPGGDASKAVDIGVGTGVDWLYDNTSVDGIVYNGRDNTTRIYIPNGQPQQVAMGYNEIRANGNGLWAGFVAAGDGKIDVYSGTKLVNTLPSACCPRWDGSFLCWMTPYQSTFRVIHAGGGERSGSFMEFDVSPLVSIEATGVYSRIMWGTPTLQDDEGDVIVEDGWVMTTSTAGGGLLIRPIGDTMGYRLRGDWYFPHFRLINGVLHIAASTGRGEPLYELIPITRQREDLRTTIIVPPPPTPAPIPVPPPEKHVKLPDNVKSALLRFATRWTVPQITDGEAISAFEDRCRLWIMKLAQYIRFVTDDNRWGTKRADPGRPPSKDSIAFNGPDGLVGWDMFSGAGTGKPTLNTDPDSAPLPGQTFISVPPFDHVGGVIVTPPPPSPSSPDLAARVEELWKQVVDNNAKLASLQMRISDLENRPAPAPAVVKFRVISDSLGEEFSTGKTFGHAHSIRLRVVPE